MLWHDNAVFYYIVILFIRIIYTLLLPIKITEKYRYNR